MRRRDADVVNAARRHTAMWFDRRTAAVAKRVRPPSAVARSGEPRFAVITVNFSTTRFLQMMLLTLAEQDDLGLVERVVVVDNGSRDGGPAFLRALAGRVPRLLLVERRHRLHHGPAMRAGVRALDAAQGADAADTLLFVDADVVFLRPDALTALADALAGHDASLVGEVRPGDPRGPDIQASLFAVRRDVYARHDVAPLVHDGSPARRMQESVVAAGLTVVDLPTNRGGLTLHRGRAGVAAAARYRPRHAYATASQQEAHFMGVADGEATWSAVEARLAPLLDGDPTRLVEVLAERLSGLGRPLPPS